MPLSASSVRAAGVLGAALVLFSACGRGPDADEGSEQGTFVPDALLEPVGQPARSAAPANEPVGQPARSAAPANELLATSGPDTSSTAVERRPELVIVAG